MKIMAFKFFNDLQAYKCFVELAPGAAKTKKIIFVNVTLGFSRRADSRRGQFHKSIESCSSSVDL